MMRQLKISIAVVLFLVPMACLSGDAADERFNRGVDLFSSGKYQDSLEEWMGIYNNGYRSAALEYNIGNACFKLNNIPRAILFYERALLLDPTDENINYNLQIARSLVADRFEDIPDLFFVKWFNYLALVNSTNGWAVISLVSFLLSIILLAFYLFSSAYRFKIGAFWSAVFLMIVFLLSLSLSIRNRSLVHDSNNAIIFSPVVNGKSSPDSSGNDLFVLHEGTKVSVEDRLGDWYEIRLSDGNKGWIPSTSLEII
jgi:tetratricopeptide (TPR) repeat protein